MLKENVLSNDYLVCDRIIHRLSKSERLLIERDPASEGILRKAWKSGFFAYLKAYSGILYLLTLRFNPKKQLFFYTFRYKELVGLLEKSQIVIFGGKDVLSEPKNQKFTCFWILGLHEASVVGLRDGHQLALKLYMRVLQIKLSNKRRYFFLYDDLLPHGVFFSEFAREYNHTTIMIQHGHSGAEGRLVEGLGCDFNLVYDEAGIGEGIPKSSCYEIGIPLQLRPLARFDYTIILLGTGLSGARPEAYKASLTTYQTITRLMAESDLSWCVFYRPHPNETTEHYAPFVKNIDRSEKRDCLSDTKKIFIGYASSMLYEAKMAGHYEINLKSHLTPNITYQPSISLDEDQIDLLPKIITDNLGDIELINPVHPPDLRARFNAALADIIQRTSNRPIAS